jgi:DNA-binding response OmpR family regulator
MANVLVIEDDATIASAVADRLRSEGFVVTVEHDGAAGFSTAERDRPDLVILDLMLPGMDGLEICRRLHANTTIPVVMLTARDDESDMLVGLAVGADDYLTKPFSMRELVARVRTVLRRAERMAVAAAVSSPVLILGDLRIDQAQRRVYQRGDEVILTPTEFDLLVCLALHEGAVRSRQQLLLDVWGYRDGSGARTIDSHVRAVRRKLGDDIIRTVHGVGYAIGEPDLASPGTVA